jgi:hypothetical protein
MQNLKKIDIKKPDFAGRANDCDFAVREFQFIQ